VNLLDIKLSKRYFTKNKKKLILKIIIWVRFNKEIRNEIKFELKKIKINGPPIQKKNTRRVSW